jgi:Spy/CpxP family protein refolding chaperone
MTMKRLTFLALAASVLLAAGSVSLTAHPQQGLGGSGPGRGMGPGGPGPFGMLQQLDLTDEQRAQIKTVLDERQANGPDQKLMDLQKQLHEAIFADAPDTAKIEELKTAIGAEEASALNSRIAVQLKIAQILTPEQRQKAREFEGRRGGRGFWRH